MNDKKLEHKLVSSVDDKGVDLAQLAEIAGVELPEDQALFSSSDSKGGQSAIVFDLVPIAARWNRRSLPPRFKGTIGQTGYNMVVHRYRFNAEAGGHSACRGIDNGGLPRHDIWLHNGSNISFQIGHAAGILTEQWTRWEHSGRKEQGINRIPIKVLGLVYIGEANTHHLIGNGADGSHFETHYVAPDVKTKLHTLSRKYYERTATKLFYNDASLPWGGVLDLNWNLQPPHHEHQDGRQIDIAATSTTLPSENEPIFLEELQKITRNYILEGGGRSRHYHVRF